VDTGYFCYLERGRRVPSVIVAEVLIDSFVQAARRGDALADEDLVWLDSIEDHVKGTDPLLNPLAPSEPPEARPQNLTPLPRRRQSARSELVLASLPWAGTCECSYIGRDGRPFALCSPRRR
jgi:hypothetical protein